MSAANNMKCDICGSNHHPMTECRDASRSMASAPCSVVDRVTAMAWDKLAIHEAIEATHPCRMETPGSYQADALAMELIRKRHDKREIVNLIRWCLMGCPPNDKDLARRALDSE